MGSQTGSRPEGLTPGYAAAFSANRLYAMDEDEDEPNDAGAEIEPASPLSPAALDPAKLPVARLASAAPSRPARTLAFSSILIGGICGGLIGFAFTDLQCDDGCTTWAGVGGVIGALIGAVGVAIVAVLTLRAMDEWETVKERNPEQHPSRRR